LSAKRCKACGETKDLELFHREKRNNDGRTGMCKACWHERTKAYRADPGNRARRNELDRARTREARKDPAVRVALAAEARRRRRANPEHERLVRQAYFAANREKMMEQQRRRRALHPEATRARGVVAAAVLSGRLPRATECKWCGSGRFVYHHHPDYDAPLRVVALCSWCHKEADVYRRAIMAAAGRVRKSQLCAA
jgi:hypothetical protein